MTGQNDRQDRSLTGQVRDQAGHCPLTGRYFQPCHGKPNMRQPDCPPKQSILVLKHNISYLVRSTTPISKTSGQSYII